MIEAQAIELIGQRFVSQWTTLTTGLPGGPYPFDLKDEAAPTADFFALCTWKHVSRTVRTLGVVNIKESRLLILVKLWALANQGGAALAQLADIARQIFESQALGSVGSSLTIFAGASGNEAVDGKWTMQMVSFPAVYRHQS